MARPKVLAVLRLIANSNLVGSWTGKAAGSEEKMKVLDGAALVGGRNEIVLKRVK
jgi:hypothetical protein